MYVYVLYILHILYTRGWPNISLADGMGQTRDFTVGDQGSSPTRDQMLRRFEVT